MLSAGLLLKGAIQFVVVQDGRLDFRDRWSAQRYIANGIDPFPVAFWIRDHGVPPPGLAPRFATSADQPFNLVDPPWVFAFGRLLYLPWRSIAAPWFLFLNFGAVAIIACSFYILGAGFPPQIRRFFTVLVFANLGFSQQLVNGNLGILSVAAIGAGVALQSPLVSQSRRRWVWSGVFLALAQVKMTIAAPYLLLFPIRRRLAPLATAILILILGSCWTSWATGASVARLTDEMLQGVNRFSTGGTGLWRAFAALGIPKTGALLLSAALLASVTIVLSRRTGSDDVGQIALLAVCARVFTYHNSLDNVVLGFLVFAAAMTWYQSGCCRTEGLLLTSLALSLLIPARIGDIAAIQIALQLFWVVSMLLVLRYRRALSPLAHPASPDLSAI